MKTLIEAAKQVGITLFQDGLRIHFSPLPNWYACFVGFDCPVCDHPITWEWVNGKLTGITNPASIEASGIRPEVKGAALDHWGHRYLYLKCADCSTVMRADNFD